MKTRKLTQYFRPWEANGAHLAIDCEKAGIWAKYGVKVIGVNTDAIEKAENREAFRVLMGELGIDVPKSEMANSFLKGKEVAQRVGFPLVYSCKLYSGWCRWSFVNEEKDFDELLKRGLPPARFIRCLSKRVFLDGKSTSLR